MSTTANLTRTAARERSTHLRVSEYLVRLDLSGAPDPARTTFPTTTTVRFTATAPTTFLDFLSEVSSVVVNGRSVVPEHDGSRVLLTGLTADGSENEVTVQGEGLYSRTGEGLHRFTDPVDGATYLYTQYEPADSRRVFATFEQPDLKASFTFEVLAPAAWEVLSNQVPAEVEDLPADGAHPALRRWTFAPSPRMSSYLTAVVAGPYHRVDGHWSAALPDGGTLEVPLGLLCRASLAEHLDAERLLEVTRQGLDFFHEAFAFPYPWGKYDQVFVPEYNLGAMENPGCVTFTESYVFRSAATRAQYQARANTILHEMAHMWFGDLVTPRWWDDLWLKESFADYMGAHASVAATEFTDAWVAFAHRRKAWAYTQDQLPTTHPIVADIPDLEAAKQNFDGITYAKGAAVLKQLVAYVGTEAFFAGVRAYFQQHQWSATTLGDLLAALEGASGRDLAAWSRVWLETAGTPVLTARVTADGDKIASLVVTQEGADPVTGQEVLRPHRLAVGLYAVTDGADGRTGGAATTLRRTHRLEVDVTGGATEVPDARGLALPDLVLVNDDDLTYAKVRLDPASLATAREHLGALTDTLPRSLVWSALWNATRDALLPAADYLDLVLRHGPGETDTAVLAGLTANARTAVEHYLPAAQRPRARGEQADGAWSRLLAAEPGSDVQLVWARALAAAAAVAPAAAPRLREVLAGEVPGLPLGPELRWSLWQSLAAVGDATREELDGELARDATADGATQHLAALVAVPDPEVKAAAWQELLTPGALTNDHVDATLAGFAQPLHRELTAPYTERYFASLRQIWAEHSIEIADRLVRGLYPAHQDAEPGRDPADHPVLRRTADWLEVNPDAPAALRRLVVEARDHLLRALRAQLASG
ncbi:aminopeptidase N [Georgenia yuyongxinii]|uniref:Aminopeptidase N n=1 Tax=Georgenia yuyongxinii TaxID=2589797 RepID=A0A552WLQ0_9MICO|nr:aminopeptidase N [Georgenia yuyongxinii]TRW43677.1 aminopeptidase N [Georgenia yuyongxinii]